MKKEEQLLINKFYTGFQEKDIDAMLACYHPELIFSDTVFRNLNFEQTKKMWTYLLAKGDKEMKLSFEVISDHEATWEAIYKFSRTGRLVHNKITAKFEFKDGKVVRHTDSFNLWKWSGMALGMPGYLLGWTPFMKNKIRKSVRPIVDQ